MLVTARLLNLPERATLLADPYDHRRGTRKQRERVAWWLEKYFLGNGQWFREWLRLREVSTRRSLERLVELEDLVPLPEGGGRKANWAAAFREALGARDEATLNPPPAGMMAPVIGLYLRWCEARVRASAGGSPSADVDVLCRGVLQYLDRRLQMTVVSTLGLALNMARIRGELVGATPEDRANSFYAGLATPEGRSKALSPFPVLDRVLSGLTADAAGAAILFRRHLAADLPRIRDQFGLKGALKAVEVGLGDPHRGGKTVCKLEFDDGLLIYKPRSVSTDVAFNGLLAWLGDRIDHAPRTMKVLDCGDHGWCEFIQNRGVDSKAEAIEAHRRLGALLAALHLVSAADIHFENIIFDGLDPYIVDLETLLSSLPKASKARKNIPDLVARVRLASLLSIGYLPMPVASATGKFDLSAAGAVSPQVSPFGGSQIEGLGGDEVRAVKASGVFEPQGNVVRIRGEVARPADYVEPICEGFRAAYNALLKAQGELDGRTGPLEGFRTVEVRFVPRPTITYATILRDSHHPSLMRDGLDREVALSRLWPGTDTQPQLKRLIRSEIDDILAGDIPLFTAAANSTDLVDSRGRVIKDFLDYSGLQGLRARVDSLSDRDRDRQVGVIRTALAAGEMEGSPVQPHAAIGPGGGRHETADWLAEALAIGERLVAEAFEAQGGYFWVAPANAGEIYYGPNVTGETLYDGLAGVALFLAELGRLTGDRRFSRAAERCRPTLRRATAGKSMNRIGAFEGLAGLLYADLRIGDCTGRHNTSAARTFLDRISRSVEADSHLDVVSGAAGALLVALGAARTPTLTDRAIEIALQCGEHLRSRAVREAGTAHWVGSASEIPLTGYSHGTSGIAHALAALSAATNRPEYAELAWEALAFEETSFDPAAGTWRDLREDMAIPMAWCHGAAGMTLARQQILKLDLPGAPGSLRTELENGLRALRAFGAGGSHCLCHGSFGNAEILLEGDPESREAGFDLISHARAERRAEGRWRGGVATFHVMPDLLTGDAGVGLALLRLIDPTIPSVLALQRRPVEVL